MKSMRLLFITLITILIYNNIHAQNFSKEKSINFWQSIGYEVFLTADFDSDGEMDILADANSGTQLIIGNITNSRVEDKYQSRVFDDIQMVEYLDTNADGIFELYVVDMDRDYVYQLDLPNLEVINTFHLDLPIFNDVDDLTFGSFIQGQPPVWYASTAYNGVFTLSPEDFSVIEELPEVLEAKKMHIGNFDSDPQNEILIYTSDLELKVLNNETYAVEQEIEKYIHNYQVADRNHDDVLEIYVEENSGELHIHDFSQSTPLTKLSNLGVDYEAFFIVDIDEDAIDDIVLYDYDDDDNDLIFVNGSNLDIRFLDLPFRDQDYSGLIIGADNLIMPQSGNLLFSGASLHSVSTDLGEVEQSVFSMGNIAIHALDNFTSSSEKQIVVSEISNNTGADVEQVILMNYDDNTLLQHLSPLQFDPENHAARLDREIRSMSIKGSPLKDLILPLPYVNNAPFYSPSNLEIYNRATFEQTYVKMYDLDGDGSEELISVNIGLNEINIYKSNSKYDWDLVLKVDARAENMEFIQMDEDPAIEIIVQGYDELKVIDGVTGSQELIETNNIFFDLTDMAIYKITQNYFGFLFLRSNQIILYDPIATSVIKTIEIPFFSIHQLDVFQMSDDGAVHNYIVGYGNRFVVFDDFLEPVVEMDNPRRLSWPYSSELIIHNIDMDENPNILVSHKYGIDDYEVQLNGQFHDPFKLINHYPKNASNVSPDATFFLDFDERVDLVELENNLSMSYEDGMDPIPFTISTAGNYKFEILPSEPLLTNKEIVISVSGTLKSHNLRSVKFPGTNSSNEDYEITFNVMEESLPPTTTLSSGEFTRAYNESKRQISIAVNSNSDDPIKAVTGGFIGSSFADYNPIDNVFDESEEHFLLMLDFMDKTLGTESFQIISTSYNGMSDTLTIPIEIVTETGNPFKRVGANQYNNYYKPMDSIGHKIVYKWSLDMEDVYDDEGAVVGEGDFIYIIKKEGDFLDPTNFLYKIEKMTGEVIFKKDIAVDASFGNLLFDNGFLYFQMNYGADPRLTCLDAENGSLVWETSFRNQHTEKYAPVVHGSYLLMSGGHTGGIYCFDRWSGKELWFHPLAFQGDWEPSVHNDIVYTSAGGIINAYDIHSGDQLWSIELPDNPSFNNSSPLIDDLNNLLIYNTSDEIYTISLEDQTTKVIGTAGFGDPNLCLRDGYLYHLTTGNEFKKINVVTGEVVISKFIPASKNEVYIFGDLVFVNGDAGTFLFDAETLESKGGFDDTEYEMNMVDNFLFVPYHDQLIAYEIKNQCVDYNTYDEEICYGTEIEIEGITYSEAGIYNDTIISVNDCDIIINLDLKTSDEITIPNVDIVEDNGNANGSITVFPEGGNEPYSYVWNNGENTQTISNLPSDDYRVTVTDSDDCDFKFSFEVPLVIGVEDLEDKRSIHPTLISSGDKIKLSGWNGVGISNVKIYSVDGMEIYSQSMVENEIRLPDNMVNGVYFIVISDTLSKEVFMEKIVVNNLK